MATTTSSVTKKKLRKPLIMALEPRVLLDGAALATGAEMLTDLDYKNQILQNQADKIAPTMPDAAIAPTQIRTADPTQNNGKKEVVFVDSSVQDYQTLIDGVGAGIEIQLIDGSKDGLAQINTWAQSHTGYDAIHILSHGSAGNIHLGTTSLTDANISQHTSELTNIGNSLTADGDILVYGCNVANGEVGKDFIGKLAQATGADIAASDDVTGSADKGGDWVLENKIGDIDSTNLIIVAQVIAGNQNTVASTTFSTLGTGASVSTPTAITLTDTSANDTFTNTTGTISATASSGAITGYGISGGTTGGSDSIGGTTYDVKKVGTYGTLYVKSSDGSYVYVPNATAVNAVSANQSETFSVQATDSNGTGSATLTINVTGANDAPVVTSVAVTSATEDIAYSYTLAATDADGNALTWSGTTLPSWLSLVEANERSVLIAGTKQAPTTNSGIYDSVNGTDASASKVFLAEGSFSAVGGKVFWADQEEYGVRYMDTDGKIQTFYAGNGNYSSLNGVGMLYDAVNDVVYVSNYAALGTIEKITRAGVKTTVATGIYFGFSLLLDTTGTKLYVGAKSSIYAVDLTNTNNSTNKITVAGTGAQGYSNTGTATTSQISVVHGMAFDGNGDLIFTDQFNDLIRKVDLDNNTITTIAGIQGANTVAGNGGLATAASFKDPSGIAIGSDGRIYIAERQSQQVRVINTDGTIEKYAEYPNVSSYVNNLTIDQASGTLYLNTSYGIYKVEPPMKLAGTPTNADVGVHNVTLRVSDGSSYSEQTFQITVANVNDAPTVANTIADQSASVSSAFSYVVPANTFADVDTGDTLTYTATLANGNALPAWLSFNAGTRTFSGTPASGDAGTISIKVTATDNGTGTLSVSDTFDITVSNGPVASSLDRAAGSTQVTNATSRNFTLVFSEAVTGVDVSDFALATTGTAGGTIGTPTSSDGGITWTIPVTGITGDGALGLNLNTTGTGIQSTGSSVALIGGYTGQTYTIDNTVNAPSTPDLDTSSDSGSSSTDNKTNDTTPTFTGSGVEAGATVTLYDTNGTTVLGTATADGSGNWSITSSALTEGTHSVTVKQTDTAGNTSTASSALSVTINTSSPTDISPNSATIATASATAGATVTNLTATDATSSDTFTYSLVSGAGDTDNASFSISGGQLVVGGSALTAGTYNVRIRATDAAGNTYEESISVSVNNAPTASSLNRETGSSATTNANSLNFTLTFSEAVSGVDVSDFALATTGTAGGTIGTPTSSDGGITWTIPVTGITGDGALGLNLNTTGTGIKNGSNVDLVGGYTGQTFTIDNTPPTTPTITSSATGNDSTPTITGTAEANSTVSVVVAGATYSVTADGSGNWTLDTGSAIPASGTLNINANGNNSISVTATDTAGNTSNATQTLAIDTTAPVFQSAATNSAGTKVILTYDSALYATTAGTGDFVVNVNGTPVTVSGVAINGSTVELTLATAVTNGQTVTVGYTAPAGNTANTNNAVQDSAGNDSVSISPASSVTNNVPAPNNGGGGGGGVTPPTPTEPVTPAPTSAPTEKPTPAPTEPVTPAPTSAPTEKPTPAPTEPVTPAPTPAPTPTPTAVVTPPVVITAPTTITPVVSIPSTAQVDAPNTTISLSSIVNGLGNLPPGVISTAGGYRMHTSFLRS